MNTFCYIHIGLGDIVLFDIKVSNEQMEIFRRHNQSEAPAFNCIFRPPFHKEVWDIIKDMKIENQSLRYSKTFEGQTIGNVAMEADRHWHGVKVVFV